EQRHESTEDAADARGAEKTPEGGRGRDNGSKAQGEHNGGKSDGRGPEAGARRQDRGAPHGERTQEPAAK
ncbi:glycerol-3-phosphate acyltransferase, partial [Mycobacterium tuberculosis]|uniref:hypothetical protein n=1 Tax=Mycobacterium tuberculosis TaxID=1773 RepID=UPI000E3613E3